MPWRSYSHSNRVRNRSIAVVFHSISIAYTAGPTNPVSSRNNCCRKSLRSSPKSLQSGYALNAYSVGRWKCHRWDCNDNPPMIWIMLATPHKIGRANRRSTSPLNAGRQFVSALCAPPVSVDGSRSPLALDQLSMLLNDTQDKDNKERAR